MQEGSKATVRSAAGSGGSAAAVGRQRWALLAAAIAVFGGLYLRIFTAPPPAGFASPKAAASAVSSAKAFYRPQLLPNSTAPSVPSGIFNATYENWAIPQSAAIAMGGCGCSS